MKLSPQEVQVMRCIWKRGEATAGEIREDMVRVEGRNFERTTISTWLLRLKRKEAICICRKGPVYKALISEEEYLKQEMNSFVDYWFEGSASKLIAAFCENEKLSDTDLQEIQELIDRMDH